MRGFPIYQFSIISETLMEALLQALFIPKITYLLINIKTTDKKSVSSFCI